jgi:hypothetical protein
MVGQADTSLVSGEFVRSRHPKSIWLIGLSLGLLAGSALVMLCAWLLGVVLGVSAFADESRLAILLICVSIFFIFDILAARHGKSSRLGVHRQTPKGLQERLRRTDVTAFVWGIDIGTGVSTYRMTSAIWLALLGVFLGLVPVSTGLLYGIGTIVAIGCLVYFSGGGVAYYKNLPRLLAARRPIQLCYIVANAIVIAVTLAEL